MNKKLTERQIWYREVYLNSDEWKHIKNQKESRTEKRCSICGLCHGGVDLHHLFYRKDLSETETSDLRWLCRKCHETAHELMRRGKLKFKKPNNHHSVFQVTKYAVQSALGIKRYNNWKKL